MLIIAGRERMTRKQSDCETFQKVPYCNSLFVPILIPILKYELLLWLHAIGSLLISNEMDQNKRYLIS